MFAVVLAVRLAPAAPALRDAAVCLILSSLSGQIGIASAAWLAMAACHRPATTSDGGVQSSVLVVTGMALCGLAVLQPFLPHALLEPDLASLFGMLAAAVQALLTWRWTKSHQAICINATLPHALASLSHELRTPLNAIIGFAGLMHAVPGDRARQQDYARIIETSGEHILSVLDAAVGNAGRTAIERASTSDPCDVAATVRIAVDMVAAIAAKQHVNVTVVAPEWPLEVDTDRRTILQIAINLVTNAIKFSPPQSAVEIVLTDCGSTVDIAVRDHGLGMAPHDLARIGIPFARANGARDRRIEGSGLGLAISKRLAGQIGGSMTFDSELGEGTTVVLSIPSKRDLSWPIPQLTSRRAVTASIQSFQ
jgi:signal transduction histidine kinase